MTKKTSQATIDKICDLLRTTDLDMTKIGAVCGVSACTVRVYAHLVEPEFQRIKADVAPEIQIAVVNDAIAGMRVGTIARRAGLTWDVCNRVIEKHRETIDAAREPAAAPAVARPVARVPDWIAQDPALKRSIDRLRAAPGIIPVGECV